MKKTPASDVDPSCASRCCAVGLSSASLVTAAPAYTRHPEMAALLSG